MRKTKKTAQRQQPPEVWKAFGAYPGIGAATAQHWRKLGMPVRREGRYTVAEPDEIRTWLAQEAHTAPAHVVTNDAEIAVALKESIATLPRRKRVRNGSDRP